MHAPPTTAKTTFRHRLLRSHALAHQTADMPRASRLPRSQLSSLQHAIVCGVVGLTAFVSAGCSSTAPKVCTAIGARSGVSVMISHGVLSSVAPTSITACADGICRTEAIDAASSPTFVALPRVRKGLVRVSVSLRQDSRQVFTGTTTAQAIKNQPNGPGCDPTAWYARVVANLNGKLTA